MQPLYGKRKRQRGVRGRYMKGHGEKDPSKTREGPREDPVRRHLYLEPPPSRTSSLQRQWTCCLAHRGGFCYGGQSRLISYSEICFLRSTQGPAFPLNNGMDGKDRTVEQALLGVPVGGEGEQRGEGGWIWLTYFLYLWNRTVKPTEIVLSRRGRG
jgi:hypothetical protein